MSGFAKPLLAACSVASLMLCGVGGAVRAQTPEPAPAAPSPAPAPVPAAPAPAPSPAPAAPSPAPSAAPAPGGGSVMQLPEVDITAPKRAQIHRAGREPASPRANIATPRTCRVANRRAGNRGQERQARRGPSQSLRPDRNRHVPNDASGDRGAAARRQRNARQGAAAGARRLAGFGGERRASRP